MALSCLKCCHVAKKIQISLNFESISFINNKQSFLCSTYLTNSFNIDFIGWAKLLFQMKNNCNVCMNLFQLIIFPIVRQCVHKRKFIKCTYTSYQWRRKWQPTPVFLPRESCGQGSLVGCRLWGRTELDTTEMTQHACMHWRRKWQPTPEFLPGESQGRRSLVGCHLQGCTELDTTEATQQQQQQQQQHILYLDLQLIIWLVFLASFNQKTKLKQRENEEGLSVIYS